MARRPMESQLYVELVDSRFNFIERGTIDINDIYDAVKRQYPNMCDDEYLCYHRQNVGLNQSEWKHVVRNALEQCKSDDLEIGGIRGSWIFS